MTTTETKSRPLLFSAPMVRAILEGRKTQTRRVVKRVPLHEDHGDPLWDSAWVDTSFGRFCLKVQYGTKDSHLGGGTVQRHYCTYGTIGDRLWVRERFRHASDSSGREFIVYESDGEVRQVGHSVGFTSVFLLEGEWTDPVDEGPLKPSIHMPRWASRLTLEVVSIRVERLQDISEADARAEGVESVAEYAALWDSINKHQQWHTNPWVWVVEFSKINNGGAS